MDTHLTKQQARRKEAFVMALQVSAQLGLKHKTLDDVLDDADRLHDYLTK